MDSNNPYQPPKEASDRQAPKAHKLTAYLDLTIGLMLIIVPLLVWYGMAEAPGLYSDPITQAFVLLGVLVTTVAIIRVVRS